MKKKALSLGLALVTVLAMLPMPALAATALEVGETITLSYSVSGGSNYTWMVDDSSVIDWSSSGSSCKITGKRPGSTTVWMFYDIRIPRPAIVDGQYTTEYDTVTENTTWSVMVTEAGSTKPGGSGTTLVPSVAYGAAGDYVGNIVDDIRAFNAGAVPVRYKGLWGLANADMELLIPFQYEDRHELNQPGYYELTENGHMVIRLNDRPYVIDREGTVIFSMPESFTGSLRVGYNTIRTVQYHNGYIYEYYYLDGKKCTSEQVKNLQKMAAEHEQDLGDLIYYYYMGEGFHMDYYGLPTGDPYKSTPTLEIPNFGKKMGDRIQEGVLVVQDEDTGLYGLVDTNGDQLLPCIYDKLYNSRDGYLAYKKGDDVGLLENPITPPSGEALKPTEPAKPTEPDTPTTPTQPTGPQSAMPTNDTLTVDGKVQAPTVYKIDGANYFKIRDLAAVLNGSAKQFEVGYDGASKSVTATSGQPYISVGGELAGAASSAQTAAVSSDKIIINGRTVEAQVYKIAGSNYFKLRDLGRALDFYVGYEKGKGMFIETDKPYTE